MQLGHLDYHNVAEANHWWFAARREIVLGLIEQCLAGRNGNTRALRLLDIGCGAGGLLTHLRRFGTVAGVDAAPEAVAYARAKGDADVRQGALPDRIPFGPDEFDVITLLDVLEHIQDDTASLRTIYRLLGPEGFLVMTVPAYPFLWSQHDILNEHKRRYRRPELHVKLERAGFRLLKLSYYNTLLFPPIAAVRLLGRLRRNQSTADQGRVGKTLNGMLRNVFAAEKHMLLQGSLPFGLSLIAIAQKPAAAVAGGGESPDA
jgi:SAM-dependent methyltransferase